MTHQYNCPDCGADPFKTADYDKITKEISELSSRYKMLSANFGKARAEWEIKEIRLEESMKWLQRKAKKQAQAIQKLEAKLRRHGERPYVEEPEEFAVRTLPSKRIVEEK